MNLRLNLEVAFTALFANKLRSALTMLGIIIGVAAVVSLVSIGEGVQNAITGEIEGVGSNIITIIPGGSFAAAAGSDAFSLEDAYAIRDNVDNLTAVAAQLTRGGRLNYEDETVNSQIMSVTASYFDIVNIELLLGRTFNQSDEDNAARVVVIDENAAEDLFGQLNPVGRDIRINGISFEVIGMSENQSSFGGGGTSIVYLPLTTAYRKLFGNTSAGGTQNPITGIIASASSPETIRQATADIRFFLRDHFRVDVGDENPFTILSQDQLLEIVGQITDILTIFLGAIAAISLLVGGIGIMNISLVSVTERTKEIGLRKAVGAKYHHIMLQFLIETMVLSTLGGIIGILLSVLLAFIITQTGVLSASITPQSIALGVGFSMAVGVFFGLYPASRAAKLDPIEALRYE
jgi:putative ABC transport system permease protein